MVERVEHCKYSVSELLATNKRHEIPGKGSIGRSPTKATVLVQETATSVRRARIQRSTIMLQLRRLFLRILQRRSAPGRWNLCKSPITVRFPVSRGGSLSVVWREHWVDIAEETQRCVCLYAKKAALTRQKCTQPKERCQLSPPGRKKKKNQALRLTRRLSAPFDNALHR